MGATKAALLSLWEKERTLYSRECLHQMTRSIRKAIKQQVGDFDPYAPPISTARPGMIANDVEDWFLDQIDRLRKESRKRKTERRRKTMTRDQALQVYRSHVLPAVTKKYEQDGRVDGSARAEAWGNFTDALCKLGLITMQQYETWGQG